MKAQAIVVTNVSKSPLTFGPQGQARITLEPGKAHTFKDDAAYVPYKSDVSALYHAKLLTINGMGEAPKAADTPHDFEQKQKAQETAQAAGMQAMNEAPAATEEKAPEADPLPTPEVMEQQAAEAEAPAASAPKKSNKKK